MTCLKTLCLLRQGRVLTDWTQSVWTSRTVTRLKMLCLLRQGRALTTWTQSVQAFPTFPYDGTLRMHASRTFRTEGTLHVPQVSSFLTPRRNAPC